jgi:nucleotide-binding universal stress UspA family protein
MSTILVATDGSAAASAAVVEAVELARLQDCQLVAVAVVKPPFPPRGDRVGAAGSRTRATTSRAALERAESAIAEALALARERGVGAEGTVAIGLPAPEICRRADECDASIIVVGTHGRRRFQRAVFGSVSTAVLHHASRPLLIVPAAVS